MALPVGDGSWRRGFDASDLDSQCQTKKNGLNEEMDGEITIFMCYALHKLSASSPKTFEEIFHLLRLKGLDRIYLL
jgi:hypothetical protein